MKFRSDFVTNSSSSSFIIGKADDNTITIDSVFCLVRDFYKEYIEKVKLLIKHADEYGLIFEEGRFKFKDQNTETFSNEPEKEIERRNREYEERRRIDRKLQDAYGFDTWESIIDFNLEDWQNDQTYPWLRFNTYRQYQEYWENRIRSSDKSQYVHAPFSIYDFAHPQSDYIAIHDGWDALSSEYDSSAEEMNFHIFGWYVPCGDHRIQGRFDESEYDYCDHCDFATRHDAACKKLRRDIESEDASVKITATNCVAMVLGRFGVLSECGYITQYVVDALASKSRYYCNQMG